MFVRLTLLTLPVVAAFASTAGAQPARIGSPAPLYLPPPVVHPQGLGTPINPIVPRPLGYQVAPYGGLGYGPLGDRTGYPGSIYSTYRGSYLNPAPYPPLILETPGNLSLRSGKLPTIPELFPSAPIVIEPVKRMPDPVPPIILEPVKRMPDPVPPGPVVPVGEGKGEGK